MLQDPRPPYQEALPGTQTTLSLGIILQRPESLFIWVHCTICSKARPQATQSSQTLQRKPHIDLSTTWRHLNGPIDHIKTRGRKNPSTQILMGSQILRSLQAVLSQSESELYSKSSSKSSSGESAMSPVMKTRMRMRRKGAVGVIRVRRKMR